ncbi:MY18B protein, partial [Atlantisia rogersi]|nr:MY18B protein [Atlantisia rogersi]
LTVSHNPGSAPEKQIRDEDRGPPPAAPPLLLSVIPGGFIKQLVRETEKEAKAAKLKKGPKGTAKDEVSSTAPMHEARVGDPPAAGGKAAGAGQPLQNGLHAEGQGGQGVTAPPHKELPPGRAAPGTSPVQAPCPAPSPAAAAPKPAETPCPE